MDIRSEEIGRKNLIKESYMCVLERKRSHKHHEERGGERTRSAMY